MHTENSRKSNVPWGKKGEYLVILQFALLLTFIVLPVYPSFSTSELFKTLTVIRWSTLVLCGVFAMVLLTLGLQKIKDSLTPLPYPVAHNQLVTTGVYALIRHPLYSCQLFTAFGWSVFSMSMSHLLMTAVSVLFFSYKAAREERWLTERHPEYADYALRVKKFIPWVY